MTWSILVREPATGAPAAAVVKRTLDGFRNASGTLAGTDSPCGVFDRTVLNAAIAREGTPSRIPGPAMLR